MMQIVLLESIGVTMENVFHRASAVTAFSTVTTSPMN